MNRQVRARRLEAAESAGRLLAEAGVDQTRQVDVFGLCEQVGLWLAFLPLDGLLGSYLPDGAGGALVTTQRPVSIQRYTAAHELGHWRLHHSRGPVFDAEEQVLGETSDENERLAQVFAASLLMPPPLVFGTLQRLSLKGDLSPSDAYTVARESGVSYEAAVRQLQNLEVIGNRRADELLRIRPVKIKTEIGWGQRPLVGTADVWPVDEGWSGQRIRVHADDEVVISLPENRSTGYRWFFEGHVPPRKPTQEPPVLQPARPSGQLGLVEQPDLFDRLSEMHEATGNPVPRLALGRARAAAGAISEPLTKIDGSMALVGDRYVTARAPETSGRDARRARLERIGADSAGGTPRSASAGLSPVIGGIGRRVLNVRFRRPGSAALRLKHRSVYSDDSDDIETYALDVDVEPRRHGLSIEQLLTVPDADWAQTVRERRSTFSGSVREQPPILKS